MNVKCGWAMYGNFDKNGYTFICRPISNGSFAKLTRQKKKKKRRHI